MSIIGKLFAKADGNKKNAPLSEDELIERLKYCKEHGLPVHHRIHGDLKVTRVEAETEPDNRASQRVLEKCGFLPSGTFGEEGPRFFRTACEQKNIGK